MFYINILYTILNGFYTYIIILYIFTDYTVYLRFNVDMCVPIKYFNIFLMEISTHNQFLKFIPRQ